MNAKRLAELRRSIDSDTYTNYLPKTVRELLDHIADLRQRPSDADALQKLLNAAYRKGNHDAHAARDACTVIMPESVPVAWIVGGIGGDHFTDFETAKTIAATYGKEPTPLYLHHPRGGAVAVPESDRPTPEFVENYVEGFDPGERSAALFGWREGRADLRKSIQPIPASQVLQPGMVQVDREELAELRGIESCVRAVRNYNGLIGTEERNRLDRLDAIRSAKGEVNG